MFFRNSLPLSLVVYEIERGGIIHDTFGVNFKNGATTVIKEKVPSIWAKGCVLAICACMHYLTGNDYPT